MSEHLEVITPTGEILFFPLDAARGVTSVGRATVNDVRIDFPGVPDHALTLDHRQRPVRLIAMANGGAIRVNQRPLAAGEAVDLALWDGVEVGQATLILAEDTPGVASPMPASAPAAVAAAAAGGMVTAPPFPTSGSLAAPAAGSALQTAQSLSYAPLTGTGAIERIKSDLVPLRLDPPVQVVDTGTPATWQLTVVNNGQNVARCTISVVGDLYASWINVSDSDFNLNERESRTVTITLLAPRHPSSRAGDHHFAVEVRLTDVVTTLAREPAQLVIQPFYQYAVSTVTPPERNLRYSQRSADFVVALENRGNSPVRYRVEALEAEKATRIEFLEETPAGLVAHLGSRELVVPPQPDPLENTPVVMRVRPAKRRLIASSPRSYAVNITVSPTQGDQGASVRQTMIRHYPFTGRWAIIVLALLAALAIVLLLRPTVRELKVAYTDPNGNDLETVIGQSGSLFEPITSRISALLGRSVLPTSDDVPIEVRDGTGVIVSWETRNGGRLDILPSAPPGDPIMQEVESIDVRDGNHAFVPRPHLDEDGRSLGKSSFELRLSNLMARLPLVGALGVQERFFEIEVVAANAPKIKKFDVSNNEPELGSSIVITWDVEMPNQGDTLVLVQTAGDRTTQTELPQPSGTIVVVPEEDTTFELAASSSVWVGGTPTQTANRDVEVIPPTPTPVPPPIIRQFDVEPLTLLQGGSITVTYNISGADRRLLRLPGLDQDVIELETDVGRRFVQVPVAGQIDVILEALNLPTGFEDVENPLDAPDRAFATQVITRIALVPTATPTSTPLPTPTATPREPEIEVLILSPVEFVLGDPTVVSLTWNVIGDADTISIDAADFTFTSARLNDTITVPADRGRTFVLTALRGGEARASKSVELKSIDPTETPPPPTPVPPPPTATPTATAVPPPQIISYDATSAQNIRREVGEDGIDIYFVDGGSEVLIRWEVADATFVNLTERSNTGTREFKDRLAKDEISITALGDLLLTIDAFNDPNGVAADNPSDTRAYGKVSRPLRIRLNPAESFDPPTNIAFSGGNAEDDPVNITWQYNPLQADRILGFRVYKAAAGSADFVPVANETELTKEIRAWKDETPPLCGRVYYMVAVFNDLTRPPSENPVETDAGNTSFLTPACP